MEKLNLKDTDFENFYFSTSAAYRHFYDEFIMDRPENYKPLIDDVNYLLDNLNYVIEESIKSKDFAWGAKLANIHWQIVELMMQIGNKLYKKEHIPEYYPVNLYQDRSKALEELTRDLQLVEIGEKHKVLDRTDYAKCEKLVKNYSKAVKNFAIEFGKSEEFIIKLLAFKRNDI